MEFRIVSGGQTGVDQGALDAALEQRIACGGWCPEGRLREDGIIPDHYPVEELKNAGYTRRTTQNVLDSDGTLILYHRELEGGTEHTVLRCIKNRKPYLLIDAAEVSMTRAVERLAEWVDQQGIRTLNVAGPRASKWPEACSHAREVVGRYLHWRRERRIYR